jgi:hypothetical protein
VNAFRINSGQIYTYTYTCGKLVNALTVGGLSTTIWESPQSRMITLALKMNNSAEDEDGSGSLAAVLTECQTFCV